MTRYDYFGPPGPYQGYQASAGGPRSCHAPYASHYGGEGEAFEYIEKPRRHGKGKQHDRSNEQVRSGTPRKAAKDYSYQPPLIPTSFHSAEEDANPDFAGAADRISLYKEIEETIEVLGDVVEMYDTVKKSKGGKSSSQLRMTCNDLFLNFPLFTFEGFAKLIIFH